MFQFWRRLPDEAPGVEDAIRTGKDCSIGEYPSISLAMNKAW
jgi:hypothetical protein